MDNNTPFILQRYQRLQISGFLSSFPSCKKWKNIYIQMWVGYISDD